MLFHELSILESLAVAFYVLTTVLLLYATSSQIRKAAPAAAVASIFTVGAANACLMWTYAGEGPYTSDRPGPIKKKKSGERGYFEFEEEGDGSGATGGSGSGSSARTSEPPVPSGPAVKSLAEIRRDCPQCPELIFVPSGLGRVGAEPDDPLAGPAERPGRNIGFAEPFLIGRFEVTNAEYDAFVSATAHPAPVCEAGHGPSPAHAAQSPVTCVSWRDAEAYVAWLGRKTGHRWRLPSEAEWEHAANGATAVRSLRPLASTTSARPKDIVRAIAPVGSATPNAIGLHDAPGSISEIVAGCWVASPSELPGNGAAMHTIGGCGMHVRRDSHAGDAEGHGRVTTRRSIAADVRQPGVGFRVARDMR